MVHRLPGCAIVCDAEGRHQGRCSVTVSAIARQIWDMKYRLKQPDGTAVDRTVQDSWRRVAAALAAGEADAGGWADRFHRAMEDFRFLPAGRILAGAGADRSLTLFNCLVMGTIPDAITGLSGHQIGRASRRVRGWQDV